MGELYIFYFSTAYCGFELVINLRTVLVISLRFDHVTNVLISLHWLRVPERIKYKIALLMYMEARRDSLDLSSVLPICPVGGLYVPRAPAPVALWCRLLNYPNSRYPSL